MNEWKEALIRRGRVARLATVDRGGRPHVVPIVYAYDGRLYTPLDDKSKRVEPGQLQRARNIDSNSAVSVIIDQYSEDWGALVWVQLRGHAEIVASGELHSRGVALLHAKYRQYREMPLDERPLIIVRVEKLIGWVAAGES